MALIYEHWRPDINECFYVGASRDAENTRPYYYGPHNDDYDDVVSILKANKLEPFTKLIWKDLEDDCVDAYEKIRIAYQRAILGKALTNRANGGQGFNINWTSEMRLEMSVKTTEYFSIQENRERNRETQKIAQNRPEVIAKKSIKSKIVMNQPEVKEKVRLGLAIANARPGALENRGKKISEGHAKKPKEERSRIASERQQAIPFEERSLIAKRRMANKSAEERSVSAKKSAEKTKEMDEEAKKVGLPTRAQRAGKKIHENYLVAVKSGEPTPRDKATETLRLKNEAAKLAGLPTSHEIAAKKAWETRRRKKAEALAKEQSNADD